MSLEEEIASCYLDWNGENPEAVLAALTRYNQALLHVEQARDVNDAITRKTHPKFKDYNAALEASNQVLFPALKEYETAWTELILATEGQEGLSQRAKTKEEYDRRMEEFEEDIQRDLNGEFDKE